MFREASLALASCILGGVADTASYAGVMKTKYPDSKRAAAKKQAGRRRAKRRQQQNYLSTVR